MAGIGLIHQLRPFVTELLTGTGGDARVQVGRVLYIGNIKVERTGHIIIGLKKFVQLIANYRIGIEVNRHIIAFQQHRHQPRPDFKRLARAGRIPYLAENLFFPSHIVDIKGNIGMKLFE